MPERWGSWIRFPASMRPGDILRVASVGPPPVIEVRGQASGTAVFSGDGTTTQFDIAHGLGVAPEVVSVDAESADANGDRHITVDATNVSVVFAAAPASGTDNVSLRWYARE